MMRHDRPRWMRVARVRARRLLSRWDRTAPLWLFWLPSWGTSILVHGVAVVILATMVYVSNRPPKEVDFDSSIISLADKDFTSLVPADHSGDPFSDARADQTPSISLEPSSSGLSQPAVASNASFSPRMSSVEPSGTGRLPSLSDKVAPPRVHAEDMTAPFSGRMGPNKAQLIRREGGTTASEMAVQNGLDWLMRHQRKDGGWSLDVRNECRIAPGCPEDVHVESDTAATGLGLLPFLGAGHIHTQPSRYQDVVQRGVNWLVANQQKSGELWFDGSQIHSQFYSHAIASMALCEAYGLSKDPRLAEPAQRAIDFICQSQNKYDGGWRYFPGAEGDTSVFGWQMFALRSARLAGLNVPKTVIKGCAHYLDVSSCDKHHTTYSYLPGGLPKNTMTAEGLLCRQYLGWTRDNPHLQTGVAGVWTDLQFSNERNIYYWYYATQLLHNMQNKAWKQWNPKVRDGLIATQMTTKECDNGSWSPIFPQPDTWGTKGGRLYQTSLSILTLEVYYRFLPLYRNDEPRASDEPPAKL